MPLDLSLSRKELLTAAVASLAATSLARTRESASADLTGAGQAAAPATDITLEDLKAVERIVGLEFTDQERKEALGELKANRASFIKAHSTEIPFTTDPMTVFTPVIAGSAPGKVKAKPSARPKTAAKTGSDLAYASIADLGQMLRLGQTTSVELTRFFLDRLKKFGGNLLCVITLTEDLAMKQAERADKELKAGHDRGPLHGIPCGVKDLFATKGYVTTWGADPYKNQQFDFDATVVEKLDAAGAVLVAKLSMGALAMDDIWFGGKTKNPWNMAQGSSGSSAGSASAVAAGLLPYAIGTETFGSITSPSLRCRVTGFRPSYGRVSRYGAMELSFTLDKIGPICREVEDCALVFAAICGHDPRDPSSVSRPFSYPKKVNLKKLKVGFLGTEEEMAKDPAAKILLDLGVTVKAHKLTEVPANVYIILDVECSSAFDKFTRTTQIRELKNSLWPQTFRGARYIPAVEYITAQRTRTLAMTKFEEEFGDYDALLADGLGPAIAHSNFGGHPQIMLPWGDNGKGDSVGRSLVGRLYEDDKLLALAKALQDRADFHHRRPAGY